MSARSHLIVALAFILADGLFSFSRHEKRVRGFGSVMMMMMMMMNEPNPGSMQVAKAPEVDFFCLASGGCVQWVWTPLNPPVARSRLFKPDLKPPPPGRSTLARNWLAKMRPKQGKTRTKTFKP